MTRPVVGISACLVGHKVRYDGGDKFHLLIDTHIAPFVDLLPFCPEEEAGLGIPRPPVQLTETGSGIKALGVEDPSFDVTHKITSIANRYTKHLSRLDAYILKSRSPSCGLEHVPVVIEGELVEKGRGLFAEKLLSQFPQLPVIEESALMTESACEAFLRAILAGNTA